VDAGILWKFIYEKKSALSRGEFSETRSARTIVLYATGKHNKNKYKFKKKKKTVFAVTSLRQLQRLGANNAPRAPDPRVTR
jgi:hypothetical protein